MSDQAEPIFQWGRLPDSCELYRAVIRPSERDKVSGKPTKLAFMRRTPNEGKLRDIHGLSVFLKEYYTKEQILTSPDFKEVFLICALTVGQVREVDVSPPLNVVRNTENHANIKDLPSRDQLPLPAEQQLLAENVANELVKRCVVIWPE